MFLVLLYEIPVCSLSILYIHLLSHTHTIQESRHYDSCPKAAIRHTINLGVASFGLTSPPRATAIETRATTIKTSRPTSYADCNSWHYQRYRNNNHKDDAYSLEQGLARSGSNFGQLEWKRRVEYVCSLARMNNDADRLANQRLVPDCWAELTLYECVAYFSYTAVCMLQWNLKLFEISASLEFKKIDRADI